MAISTQPTKADVGEFIDAVPNGKRRDQARELCLLMSEVTGAEPVMWGSSIIGFGSFRFETTRDEYDWFVLGFSPRKAALTIYGVYNDYEPTPRIVDLGEVTTGKGCLYVTDLGLVDRIVLTELIREAWLSQPPS